MAGTNDYLKEVEYLAIYPNNEGDKTFLATALTEGGYRVLLYAPSVTTPQLNMSTIQDYDEIHDARGIPVLHLSRYRGLKIENTAILMKNHHNENEDWYLKVVYLDGPESKRHINKAELEKLLGCVIDG